MNITLIGMPGAGKSVIGKKLAKRLNYKFLDIDKIIEKESKLKLQQMIDSFGDNKFLKIEEKTILKLDKLDNFNNYVISPGGSAVYSSKAMEFFKKNSIVIFLNCSFKNIKDYLPNISQRGIIGLKNKGLKTLFKERILLYKKYADITLKIIGDYNVNVIANNIIDKIIG